MSREDQNMKKSCECSNVVSFEYDLKKPSLFDTLPTEWKEFLDMDKFAQLDQDILTLYETQTVFPAMKNVFRAFELCRLDDVKVIIIGQDPYHTPGQANGLAFSCADTGNLQPTLRNILKEVQRSMASTIETRKVEDGNLEPWAMQGVLLLNTVLTVQAHQANSHRGKGWEAFTDHVIQKLLSTKRHLVVMQWGKNAISIQLPKDARLNHLILQASHPSPLSFNISFSGCDHFAMCNRYLLKHSRSQVKWI